MSQRMTHDRAPRDAELGRDTLTAEDDVLGADDHGVLLYDSAEIPTITSRGHPAG
jgi:hypothetical protein